MNNTPFTTRRRGRRPAMSQVCVSLPDDVLTAVERQANIYRRDRSQVLRDLVIEALAHKGKLSLVAEA